MKILQKASRAFEAALKRDCAWFQSNPAKTQLRRQVTGWELPRHLRGLGIAEVSLPLEGLHDIFVIVSSDQKLVIDTAKGLENP
jgi:hypothetical protein